MIIVTPKRTSSLGKKKLLIVHPSEYDELEMFDDPMPEKTRPLLPEEFIQDDIAYVDARVSRKIDGPAHKGDISGDGTTLHVGQYYDSHIKWGKSVLYHMYKA